MANRYWVGGTGTWDKTDTSHWSASSGGAGGASVPVITDNVYVNANSGSGTIIAKGGTYCLDLDFTGYTGTWYGDLQGGNDQWFNIQGSLIFGAGMTLGGTSYGNLRMTGVTRSITTNGVTITGIDFEISGNGGTCTLTDSFYSPNGFFLCQNSNGGGTLTVTSDFTVGGMLYWENTASPGNRTINMGTGTWTFTGYDSQFGSYKTFDIRHTGAGGYTLTINPSTSLIKFTNNSSSAKSFVGVSKTFNNLWINTSGTGIFYFYNSNGFNNITIDAGRTVYFVDGTTQTVSTLTAVGTYTSKITMRGTGALGWGIIDTSGTNNCEWLDIDYSTASGGATFNSLGYVDGGHNTGWNFVSVVPIISTTSATVTGEETITGVGNVANDGGSTILERGFCYSTTNSSPTIADDISITSGTTGSYNTYIINLKYGTKYYVRAYATNAVGTSYGSVLTRTTTSASINVSDLLNISRSVTTSPATIMEVNKYDTLNISESRTINISLIMDTAAVSSIGVLTATANGEILSIGSANATIRGAVWSTTSHSDPGNVAPTSSFYGGHNESSGSYGVGTYTTSMTGLISSTNYYVRSYAYNPYGYKYGPEVTFKTGGFLNPENIYADDGSYATFDATSGNLTVELSKDAGANWQTPLIKTFGASDTTETYGSGASELWGSSWTVADMIDANFRVRLSQGDIKQVYNTFGFTTGTETLTGIEVVVKGNYNSPTMSLDVLKVKIYYGTSILPVQEGSMVYCSDGRKNGEGAGDGTGVLVYYAKTDLVGNYGWIASDTGVEVVS